MRCRARPERKKLKAESEGLIGPKRADKARSAVLTSDSRRLERANMLWYMPLTHTFRLLV
jgi:hypothetical protein